MADSVGVYELSRRLKGLIAEVARGGRPVLVTRYDRPVAFLVSVEVGLPAAPVASAVVEVGIARLAMELSAVLQSVEKEGRVVVITRHRRGLAALVPATGPLMDEYRLARQQDLDDLLRRLSDQEGQATDATPTSAAG